MAEYKNQTELAFEKEVVDYLTRLGGVQQWDYREDIKTTKALWDNFKEILEKKNALAKPLSETEFYQVKKIISDLKTPYEAGQFLYGRHGICQIEVDMDSGEHKFLTVFEQAQVGSRETTYQVVRQIQRPKIQAGLKDRRFDVTLLINGLPIIQIELKKALHSTKESFNQMKQYIAEGQYGDIFSTLQILVAMTPHASQYMANTTSQLFNTAFAFNWQEEESAKPVRHWQDFAKQVLSIPMAHNLATQYMVLDGTKNKEAIKVMRPYQVYATQRVIDAVRKYDFRHGDPRLGYVWHTTGSGKTITSFKTAWLASRLPHVSKVIFLVDRIALTNQTSDAYKAYDPNSQVGGKGVIGDTAHMKDLHDKLTKKTDTNIIVTSIQKMSKYVQSDQFKGYKGNILFIVDEAHRSTGDGENEGMLEAIKKALPTAAWVGYTGTPKFPLTREIFGNLLHAYTIKEAIADKNVLGFNVEFKETIPAPKIEGDALLTDQEKGSIYDTDPDHVRLVVQDIFDHWQERSNNRKYNALFSVKVGGGKVSVPRAMDYYDAFQAENAKRAPQDRLKVGISFASSTNNSDNQLEINQALRRVIGDYKDLFHINLDESDTRAYTDDLARRLNKTADDGNYLDLAIVIDQLLTGFDAPEMNTLYLDRTLKGGNLIQAYSRTNRMHKLADKPFGNVVNYRFPVENEEEMNKAFALYSNRGSASENLDLLSVDELKRLNRQNNILSRSYEELKSEMIDVVTRLSDLTEDFVMAPASERDKEEALNQLRAYNHLLSQLKQYTVDDLGQATQVYDETEAFYASFGMSEDKSIMLTSVIAEDLRDYVAERDQVEVPQVDLNLVHIHEVRINYDYLVDLIARLANQVKAGDQDGAKTTLGDIKQELAKGDNDREKLAYGDFVDAIYSGDYRFKAYPVSNRVDLMQEAMADAKRAKDLALIAAFNKRFGLDKDAQDLLDMMAYHEVGQRDLDDQKALTQLVNANKGFYKDQAQDETIKAMNWIKYLIGFKEAFYQLADAIKK